MTSLFEPELSKNLPRLTPSMAASALIGYSNPNLKNKYPIKNELIDVILRNIEDLRLE